MRIRSIWSWGWGDDLRVSTGCEEILTTEDTGDTEEGNIVSTTEDTGDTGDTEEVKISTPQRTRRNTEEVKIPTLSQRTREEWGIPSLFFFIFLAR